MAGQADHDEIKRQQKQRDVVPSDRDGEPSGPEICVQKIAGASEGNYVSGEPGHCERKYGRVIQAKLIQRTGYPEVDTPIRTSLYRWTATGKKLAEIDGPFQIQIDMDIRVRLR